MISKIDYYYTGDGKNMKKKIVILPLIVLIVFSHSGFYQIENTKAVETTFYVDGDGFEDYVNIQDAIDNASIGNIVYVHHGYYQENLLITKSITLIGEDKVNTTIDGENGIVISIISNNVEIIGFTIKNGIKGIMLENSSENIIKNNTIEDNNYGIYIDNLSVNNTIYQNNFLNNINNVFDLSTNFWNLSSSGNFWDDYLGMDSDDNGIGDTPYNISGGNNKDLHPLMEPITEKPEADFIYLPTNPNTQDVIQFNDTSKDMDGYIVTWSWNFGDGNISTKQNATHNYVDNGVYNITLKINDNYGATDEISKQLSVLNVGPTADFEYSPSNPTDLQSVIFIDTSYDLDGNIINWSWDFGDENNSNLQNPSYQYSDNGTYSITLTIIDDDGAKDVKSKQISVSNVGPIVDFSFFSDNVTLIANDPIRFVDTSSDLDGEIVSRSWDLGDGTVSTEEHFTHNYEKGTYTISLTVMDNDGVSSTKSKYITVSVFTGPNELVKGFSTFDIIFVVFLIAMVGLVIFLSRKYS